MSTSQQDRDRPPRRLIPRSPTQPDLLRDVPLSTASNASPSEKDKRADLESFFVTNESTADPENMPQYTSRDVGDPTQIKKNKQSMADLKLRRLTELNNRLREDLERERIPVSQASKR